jgi:hypothetical protein
VFDLPSTFLSSPGNRTSRNIHVIKRYDGNNDQRRREAFASRISGLAKRMGDDAIVTKPGAELYT